MRVMLADDHAVVRNGLKRLLEHSGNFEVVAEVSTAEEAWREYANHRPDVLVMDLSMPGCGGMEGLHHIVSREPQARVLIFTIHENALLAERALQAGALGYASKSSPPEVLVEAVASVGNGKRYLSPDVAQSLALKSLEQDSNPMSELSPREFEIFRMVAEGKTVGQISESLFLAEKTISNYISKIKQKLNVATTAELVHLALKYQVISV